MNALLARAAAGLRILAQVERAHCLEDTREVERLLAGVDPVDLAQTVSELLFLAKILPQPTPASPSFGTDGSVQASGSAPQLRMVPCE